MNALRIPPLLKTAIRCQVAAHELVRAAASDIADWRRRPICAGAEKLPASFLKHAEEPTVAAVWSVLRILDRHGWRNRSFADWGVIAGPSMCGRVTNAQAIDRYRKEGAWGISPHLIPHQSLHAMSGTISQLLKIYGPNFGVNGGPNAGVDAFLAAATLLADGALPGLWLLMTGYETEWLPARDGLTGPAPDCVALALALTPDQPDSGGLHLTIGQAENAPDLAIFPEFHLSAFADENPDPARMRSGKWRLSDTCWLEFDSTMSVV